MLSFFYSDSFKQEVIQSEGKKLFGVVSKSRWNGALLSQKLTTKNFFLSRQRLFL